MVVYIPRMYPSMHPINYVNINNSLISINHNNFLSDCSPGTFICPGDPEFTCVSNTLACDGRVDCPNGVDESPEACGKLVDSKLIKYDAGKVLLLQT